MSGKRNGFCAPNKLESSCHDMCAVFWSSIRPLSCDGSMAEPPQSVVGEVLEENALVLDLRFGGGEEKRRVIAIRPGGKAADKKLHVQRPRLSRSGTLLVETGRRSGTSGCLDASTPRRLAMLLPEARNVATTFSRSSILIQFLLLQQEKFPSTSLIVLYFDTSPEPSSYFEFSTTPCPTHHLPPVHEAASKDVVADAVEAVVVAVTKTSKGSPRKRGRRKRIF